LTAGTWFRSALTLAVALAPAVKPALHAFTAVMLMLMLMQFWTTQSATLKYGKSAFEAPVVGGSSAE